MGKSHGAGMGQVADRVGKARDKIIIIHHDYLENLRSNSTSLDPLRNFHIFILAYLHIIALANSLIPLWVLNL